MVQRSVLYQVYRLGRTLKTFKTFIPLPYILIEKRQKEYYEQIIQIKPKRVIFNPGTENPEFYKILSNNEIEVEVACTLVLLATDQY